jgi:hypothetical protein
MRPGTLGALTFMALISRACARGARQLTASRRTLMMMLLLRPPAARFSYGVIENRRH